MEISLYAHIPFCTSKCHYCDFVSYAGQEDRIGEYIKALSKEMELRAGFKVKTVYIGGGTPTCIDRIYLENIFSGLYNNFSMENCAEINIEANPGTLSKDKLDCLKGLGVNRLSIGLQSWHEGELKRLGRIHGRNEFVTNFREARKLGFDNINVDLMFGIPGQDLNGWRVTLKEVTDLEPEHISCYSLKIEEGTTFYRLVGMGLMEEADQDLDREMYHFAVDYLAAKGYRRYEISNFAKKGRECLHNMTYWENKPYIGFGAAAHSYVNGVRTWNTSDLNEYCDLLEGGVVPERGREEITRDMEIFETIFLKLRTARGILFNEFCSRFGFDIREAYGKQIENLKGKGLISVTEKGISLTSRGMDLSNMVFSEFMVH
jgi:oxygen-independent coproporphyrinogen-3 oxidase